MEKDKSGGAASVHGCSGASGPETGADGSVASCGCGEPPARRSWIKTLIFALGYSLPLAAGVVGIGFGLGRLRRAAQRVMPAVRVGAGVVLVGVGFYLLVTV